jgi:hypothetical protein
MFQLTSAEASALRSQFATSKGRGGRRYAPYVFTEQGVAMPSSVLRSPTALEANIAIMRAFVELRRAAMSYVEIERRLSERERESPDKLSNQDQKLAHVFERRSANSSHRHRARNAVSASAHPRTASPVLSSTNAGFSRKAAAQREPAADDSRAPVPRSAFLVARH